LTHQYTYPTIWEPWEMLQSIQEPIKDCELPISLLVPHTPKSFAYAARLPMGYRLRLPTPIENRPVLRSQFGNDGRFAPRGPTFFISYITSLLVRTEKPPKVAVVIDPSALFLCHSSISFIGSTNNGCKSKSAQVAETYSTVRVKLNLNTYLFHFASEQKKGPR
jgi:hypothetical protein